MLWVSVVVPTYRRPLLLRRCLDALLAQDLPPEHYEILVADDAADPETERMLGAMKRGRTGLPALRYVAVGPAHGPAAARNCGWRAARAPIIAFTDDDTAAHPAWLAEGLAALARGAGAVWGRIEMPPARVTTDYSRDAARLASAGFVTANCFVRTQVLHLVGGFDERYTEAWREDSDLFFALLAHGIEPVYAPRAAVVHPIRPAPWGVSLKQQRKIRFDALLYKKYPALYRRYIRARPQWRYYAIVACLAATLGGALARSPLVLAGAATVWIALTAAFFLDRLRGTTRAPAHVAEMLVTSCAIPPLAVFWRLVGALKFRSALW